MMSKLSSAHQPRMEWLARRASSFTPRRTYSARVPVLQMQEHSGTRYTRQPIQSHNLRSKRAIARSQTRFCCAGRAKRERKIATPLDVMHNAMKSRKLNGLTVELISRDAADNQRNRRMTRNPVDHRRRCQ